MTVFGVHVGLQHTTADELRSVWREIEDLGFGWISVWDHFYGATGKPDDRAGDISGFVPEPVNAGYENKRKHQGGRPNPQDRTSSVQPNTSNGGPL